MQHRFGADEDSRGGQYVVVVRRGDVDDGLPREGLELVTHAGDTGAEDFEARRTTREAHRRPYRPAPPAHEVARVVLAHGRRAALAARQRCAGRAREEAGPALAVEHADDAVTVSDMAGQPF